MLFHHDSSPYFIMPHNVGLLLRPRMTTKGKWYQQLESNTKTKEEAEEEIERPTFLHTFCPMPKTVAALSLFLSLTHTYTHSHTHFLSQLFFHVPAHSQKEKER
jgi:hypothetical protein